MSFSFRRWLKGFAQSNRGRQGAPRQPAGVGRRVRPWVESLEDRLAPATITVLTTGDATGSLTPVAAGVFTAPTLRAAIDGANSLGGADTI
jgi:hypothetical protein